MSGTRTWSLPNNNIAQRRLPVLRPPQSDGERFNGEQGGEFPELNSYEQNIQREESCEHHITRKSGETTAISDILEKYRNTRRSSRQTLANCNLELQVPILTISPKSSSDFEFNSAEINLADYVGDIGGELVWGGGAGRFSDSCFGIRLEGTFLLASSLFDENERWLNLDDHITYITARRCFEPAAPDLDFAEFVSSARWMNLTVITQPDMRSFFRDPTFQKVISRIAHRAIEEVMSQIKEEMIGAVEQAVIKISAESRRFVDSEMDTLVKKATRTASYTGLRQLTMMGPKQRVAFNHFAPTISAAPIIEEMN
ncbi:hypothetical protein C8R45DRAFT_1073022, partial [Mycena sanguinolenta]